MLTMLVPSTDLMGCSSEPCTIMVCFMLDRPYSKHHYVEINFLSFLSDPAPISFTTLSGKKKKEKKHVTCDM